MSALNLPFKALADPTRRKIIMLLKKESLTPGEIAEHFDMTKPSISHHLNMLKQADLVSDERKGQNIYYSLNTTVFQEVMQLIIMKEMSLMTKKILNFIKKDWFIIAILALTFMVSLYFYPRLPNRVPSHWNIKGQIDGYSGRFFGAFGIPLMNLAFYFLFIFLPYLDPKKANYAKFPSAYKSIRYSFHMLFAGIQAIVLLVALGYHINVGMFIGLGISLLFVVIGNVMGKFKHNYFVGIKTPWTLANEEVWVKTHRMAAPLWVVGGILSAIFAIFGGGTSSFIALMLIVSVISIVPIVYSYVIFKKLNEI